MSGQPINLSGHPVSFKPQNMILSVSGLGFCWGYIYIFIELDRPVNKPTHLTTRSIPARPELELDLDTIEAHSLLLKPARLASDTYPTCLIKLEGGSWVRLILVELVKSSLGLFRACELTRLTRESPGSPDSFKACELGLFYHLT